MKKVFVAADHEWSSRLGDGQTMLGIFWSGFCGICTYTCIGNSITVCPISEARWLRGAHMGSGRQWNVQYVCISLLSIFGCFYVIIRSQGHAKLLQEVSGGVRWGVQAGGAEGIWLRQESKESNLVHASMRNASGCLFVIIHADRSSWQCWRSPLHVVLSPKLKQMCNLLQKNWDAKCAMGCDDTIGESGGHFGPLGGQFWAFQGSKGGYWRVEKLQSKWR